ncbi:hypothetical protein BHE74_00059177, partial [Ensete ventricosum]
SEVDKVIEEADKVKSYGEKLSKSLPLGGHEDISILAVPSTALEMVVDYFNYDYEFAEPPRVTSLQNTVPLPTFANFGKEAYFVADQRGFESLVYDLAAQFLRTAKNSSIVDPRLLLGKVNASQYSFLDRSVICGKLDLIRSSLQSHYDLLPKEHFEKQNPGANVLLVTVTDEESRRIEQQPDSQTKAEAMEVLRNMFGKHIPEATDVLVPKWWSDRFFKGSFSNWPLGVNQYEYDQMRVIFISYISFL